jgi:hypothetical protein
LEQVRTHTTPDLNKPGTREFVKTHDVTHPRGIILITLPFYLIEKLARSKFLIASINGTARVGLPLPAGA